MCCIMRNIEKCGDFTVRLGKADGKKYYSIGVSSLETLSEKLLERHSPVAMETQLGQTLESVLFKVVD